MKITRIGLDIAKEVFVVHAVDRTDKATLNKRLSRAKVRDFFAQLEPCLVAMESCGGAHYWARELAALGHEVRLIAPQFVSPYRRGGKNDDNDACAICKLRVDPICGLSRSRASNSRLC